jgi:tRNA threonylcarbamoyladenosine biosynthesis protein TsaB
LNLLAFDTSTEFLSIAIVRGEVLFSFDTLAGQSHSQLILPEIQKLLTSADIPLSDLNGLVFGAGPGSFTGVRIAAGVAQGLAYGTNFPVVGVCTLMALAQASGADKVIACLDARMGEVYHAAYVKENGLWQALCEPGLFKPDAVPEIAGTDWVGAGSGWQTYGEILSNRYHQQLEQTLPELLPKAIAMLQLAQPIFASGKALTASDAMPIYIRNRVALKTAERAEGLRL